MAQKIKTIVIVLSLLTPAFFAAPALAQGTPPCAVQGNPANCGTGDTGIPISSDCQSTAAANGTVDSAEVNNCLKSDPIITDINTVVDFLSAGVGVVVVGSLILGGIQYSMAGDSPDALSKAKKRITNSLLALVAFIFTFAFLQWLIPGGVFG